jgi:hypothetical protein
MEEEKKDVTKNAEGVKPVSKKQELENTNPTIEQVAKNELAEIKASLVETNKKLSEISENVESFVLAWSEMELRANTVKPAIIEYKPKEKKKSNEKRVK